MNLDDLPTLNTEGLGEIFPDAERDDRATGDQLPERIAGCELDPKLLRGYTRRRHLRMLRNEAAAKAIGELPGPGEELILVMTGQYHGIELLDAMIELADCPVQECFIATLGTNKSNIAAVCEHIDAGRIERLMMFVADVFAAKDHAEMSYLRLMLDARGQRWAVARNHTKLILLHLQDGRKFVLHGSLNLRRCNSFEQAAISQDADTHDFFRDWIEQVALENTP
ncbi:MAG: hypothetical protein AAF589_00740 [Planctomycetota bacterium]